SATRFTYTLYLHDALPIFTHEMHVIRKICDRAAVMENGKVVEVGPVIELFQNPQSEVTKRFVKDDISDDDHTVAMDEIKQAFPTSTIVKLTFVGTQTKSPIVSEVIRNYSLDMNILSGNIKQTNQESYGHLFIALDINQETLEKITEEFARHDVTLEVESQ